MNYSIFKLCVFYTAPSGTPASVAAKAVSSTKVEVSWKVKFCLSFITLYLNLMIIFANWVLKWKSDCELKNLIWK